MELKDILNSNLILLVLILIIIFLDYKIERKLLGVIILHNNDHTLNKLLQFINILMEHKEIHYQILVLKEKKKKPHRSTGFLFNLGYRHLPRFNNYLFIDSTDLDLGKFYKNFNKILEINPKSMFVQNKINYLEEISGVFVSKNNFKRIDGFSNEPNKNFKEFVKYINNRKEHNGYSNINKLELQYDIMERVPINNSTSKMIINYF